jgi:hypothetical protein
MIDLNQRILMCNDMAAGRRVGELFLNLMAVKLRYPTLLPEAGEK